MNKTLAAILILIGGFLGFIFGVGGWLGFYYVVFMMPNHTPFRYIDQAAIPTMITGPIFGYAFARITGVALRNHVQWNTPSGTDENKPAG